MTKMSPALIKAQKKYDKSKTKSFTFKFNKRTDADIINHLDGMENKQGYIKELIRKDLKNN